VPLSRNFLLAKLEQKNPELNALHFEMLKAREEKKRALQAYFPNLKFFSSYTFVDPAMPNAMTGMIPADSGKDAFTLGGGLEVPIWFFKNYAEHKEASLRQNAVMNRKVGLRNTLEKNVEKIFFKVRDAERKIDLYKTILIPKAEEALKSAITAFSSGNIDFVNLIDTERTALEFSLVYERSLTNYLQGLAQLEVLMGSEFSQLDMGSKETGDKP
jgi:outer membrane protein TolC